MYRICSLSSQIMKIENLSGPWLGRMRLAGLVVQIGISAPRVIRGTRHADAGTGRRRSAQSVWVSWGGGVSAGRWVSAGGGVSSGGGSAQAAGDLGGPVGQDDAGARPADSGERLHAYAVATPL